MRSRVTELVTPRLLLRPIVWEDLEQLAAMWRDPVAMSQIGTRIRDAARSRKRVSELIEHQHWHGFGKWAVIERAGCEVIGYCGIELYFGGPDVELGFTIARPFWGQGYATEAAAVWLRHGFETLGFPRVLALVVPANAASIRVLEKLGLERIGVVNVESLDWLLYETRDSAAITASALDAISRSPL